MSDSEYSNPNSNSNPNPNPNSNSNPETDQAVSPALRIAMAAVLTAVTVVFTFMVRIPIAPTRGYINLGDVAIYFTAFTFGPITALIAGGVGTALADLLAGYGQWAPISLVIHGAQGLTAGLIIRGAVKNRRRRTVKAERKQKTQKTQKTANTNTEFTENNAQNNAESHAEKSEGKTSMSILPRYGIITAGIVGTIIMAGLYFLAGGMMVGYQAAAVEIFGNIMQNVVGVILGALLSAGIYKAYPPVERLSW